MIVFNKIDQIIKSLGYDTWTPIAQVLQMCYDVSVEARKKKDWMSLEILQEMLQDWSDSTNKTAPIRNRYIQEPVVKLMVDRVQVETKKLLQLVDQMLLGKKEKWMNQ